MYKIALLFLSISGAIAAPAAVEHFLQARQDGAATCWTYYGVLEQGVNSWEGGLYCCSEFKDLDGDKETHNVGEREAGQNCKPVSNGLVDGGPNTVKGAGVCPGNADFSKEWLMLPIACCQRLSDGRMECLNNQGHQDLIRVGKFPAGKSLVPPKETLKIA